MYIYIYTYIHTYPGYMIDDLSKRTINCLTLFAIGPE